MAKKNENKKVKKVTLEVPRESLVPEVMPQENYTPSELAKDRIKRHFHKTHLGRDRIPIDWAKFEEMARLGMRVKHVAARLGVSTDTLLRRCKEEFGTDPQHVIMGLSGDMRQALMSELWRKALKEKDNFIMTHMSKHMLDMHEKKMEIDQSPEDETPQTVEYSPSVMGIKGETSPQQIRDMMSQYLNTPQEIVTADKENQDDN